MAALLGLVVILLLATMVITALSYLIMIFRIVVECVLINKADGNWWKGLIPFYRRWVYLHIGFGHKTAIMMFVIDMILYAITFCLRLVLNITQEVSDAITESADLSSLMTDSTRLTVDGAIIILSLVTLIFLFVFALERRFQTFALCRAFGKETGFCVAAFFVPTIISAIIAFGSSEYMEDVIEIIPEY